MLDPGRAGWMLAWHLLHVRRDPAATRFIVGIFPELAQNIQQWAGLMFQLEPDALPALEALVKNPPHKMAQRQLRKIVAHVKKKAG